MGFPDRKEGPFVLSAHWIEQDGRMVPVGIEVWKGVEPSPDRFAVQPLGDGSVGLETKDLRKIPLATVLADMWDMQQEAQQAARGAMEGLAAQTGLTDKLEPPRFTGRYHRVSSEDVKFFRKVAAVYLDAMRSPGRKRPTFAVQSAFGVSPSAATKYVKRARELHLLPATTSGKPSAIMPSKRTSRRRRQ